MGMTNQEAIKRIEEHIAIHKYRESHAMHIVEALDLAISALQSQDVPDTNVSDMISRKAAIDALLEEVRLVDGYYVENDEVIDKGDAIEAIRLLSSAEPEITRCDKCKHGVHSGRGNVYICHISPELVMEHTGDFYCGYAERQTDGQVN